MISSDSDLSRQPLPVLEGLPRISVIIPCRNEAGWIARCLDSLLSGVYPRDRLEILVVDGRSDDGTREILEEYQRRNAELRVLDNPKRIVPTAMNMGLAHAKGDIIVRMDAHCVYPANYISLLVEWLERSKADNVGGVCRTISGTDTAMAKAIAAALSHRFGIGNAHWRLGVNKPQWVDTVPFGCYRREVFQRIGGFDEELIRNQDDEFNLRLIRAGGRILLVPDIVITYCARDSLKKLWRMYFQYGYFKPLVLRKVGRLMTFRQVVPSLFLSGLAISGMAAFFYPLALIVFCALLASYTLAIAGIALAGFSKRGAGCSLRLFLAFPTLHFAYGMGFLKGILAFLIFRRRVTSTANTPISR